MPKQVKSGDGQNEVPTFFEPELGEKSSLNKSLKSYNSVDEEKQNTKSSTDQDESLSKGQIPVNDVGILSYTFITWLTPLIMKMYKNRDGHLKESEIWRCSDLEKCKRNTDRLEEIWEEEVKNKGKDKASFEWCWWRFCRLRMFASLPGIFVNATAAFLVSGLLLNEIIAYLENVESDLLYGAELVTAMLIANVIRAGSMIFIMVYGAQTGTRFRAAYLGLAYRKLIRLQQLKGSKLAEVITIFGGDAYRVYIKSIYVQYLVALPVYTAISIAYTYYLIGAWCFIAIGVFALAYLIQGGLAKLGAMARRSTLFFTDKRVRKTAEVLNSIKCIKMSAWEDPFQKDILELRQKEKQYLMLSAIISSIGNAIIPIAPTLASVATIAAYKAFGNDITASTAFAIIGTLSFLRIIVIFLPTAARNLGEVHVSFQRMKHLLTSEEYKPPSRECKNRNNAVEIENGLFTWDEKIKNNKNAESDDEGNPTNAFSLSGIKFSVEKGQLIGICGSIGTGKSSLFSAVLGRMPMKYGRLAVNGNVAYVSQQAWIFNDTFRENILFGKPYCKERYQNVIQACGLGPDLKILDNGDQTEIGNNGANLSGGQKQRLSLARAVYSDCDIYLLDDPLSAVDVHVGQHLFHECIKRELAAKTIILATHQLQYLQYCDEIVTLEDGQINERGSHSDLMNKEGFYKNMIDKMQESTTKSTENGDSSKSEKSSDDEIQITTVYGQVTKRSTERSRSTKETEKPKGKGKIYEKEEMEKGRVKFSTYGSYINAAGGVCVCILVLMVYTLSTGSVVFSDWWLGFWINSLKTGINRNSSFSNQSASIGGFSRNEGVYLNGSFDNQSESMDSFLSNQSTIMDPYSNNMTVPAVLHTGVLDVYFLVYIASMGGIIVFTLLTGLIGASVTTRAAVRLHKKALQNVIRAPMKFFDSNPPGSILNRFSKDLDEVDVNLPQYIDSELQLLNTVILSIISASIVLPWIIIALVPIFILFVIIKNISRASVTQMKRISNVSTSPLLAHINTTVQGLATVTSYNQQDKFIARSEKLIDVTSAATFLFHVCMRWIGLRLDLVSALMMVISSLILVCTKGTVASALGALSLTMCLKVVVNMQVMVRYMNQIEARFTAVERLNHYVKNVPTETDSHDTDPDDNWPSKGMISVNKAEMKYRDNSKAVLKQISFDVEPQMKVGIVGRTGAGKSSLATVPFRLIELSDGHIEIDGINICNVPLKILRSRIGNIPQDPVLFSGTLRYNLDPLGKYGDDELWRSLELAHIKEKISQFKEGLDYRIEENGNNFSVGERQLICLARAILRKNKILILDEATASVDTHTDFLIQQTIQEAFSDCTVLTVAHRLNTILHSDLIMILENGQIKEMGTPKNLIANFDSHLNEMIRVHSSSGISVEE